jgi:DNA modification methylase
MTSENPLQLIHGDARHIPLADGSVQCIVTSPPYWGLRKYAGNQELIWEPPVVALGDTLLCAAEGHLWITEENVGGGKVNGKERWNHTGHGEHGHATSTTNTCARCGCWKGAYVLEPTIEMYVQHTVEILREMRRVLRPDGVLFWNIGDSYASHARNTGGFSESSTLKGFTSADVKGRVLAREQKPMRRDLSSLKPKDLCLIPSRVAIAAQADGWWVRSMIVWAKPNPMPESCTDRPTDSYEHILMFTKSERYYWDADAVREPAATGWNGSSFTDARDAAVYPNLGHGPRNTFGYASKGTHSRGKGDDGPKARARAKEGVHEDWAESTRDVLGYRNIRNVWMFPTQPYSGAHFATFPEELPRRCILATTSARGACTQCGAPWERVTSRDVHFDSGSGRAGNPPAGKNGADYEQAQSGDYDIRMGPVVNVETIGWRPTCTCSGQHGKTAPCLVLDPFGGSGTTGRVALELRRRAVLVDIAYDAEYRELAERRTSGVNVKLPFL